MENEVDNKTLDIFEERLLKLENKIVGQEEQTLFFEGDDMISTLSTLESKLGNALSTRDRMMMVMKRMEELHRYLDPNYGETLALDDDVKADLIFSQEEKLQAQYQQLMKITSLKTYLDSQNISDILRDTNNDLAQIWQKNNEVSDLVSLDSEKITHMLEYYNSIILTLTETFIHMDSLVTKAELELDTPKTRD